MGRVFVFSAFMGWLSAARQKWPISTLTQRFAGVKYADAGKRI